jgi:hypothetical protein
LYSKVSFTIPEIVFFPERTPLINPFFTKMLLPTPGEPCGPGSPFLLQEVKINPDNNIA